MAGYTRQSAADIIPGAEVTAAPLNAEFNQLQSAMHGSTGHNHQGGSGNGPQLSLTAAVTGVLPIANGGTNASTAAAARTSLFGVSTTVDNTLPRFDGTTGSLQTSGIVVSDTNAVSGIVGLTVTGGGSLTGTWSDLGTVTTIDINGGTIDGVTANFVDASFTLLGSSDATKKAAFQVDNITTGTTRTVTIPDADFTIVGTDTTQTLTNKSIAATQLTGTIASARISGSYTGITGTGALAAGSITSGFGNINIGASTFDTTGAVGTGALTATQIISSGASQNSFTGPVSVADGSAAFPGLRFTTDTNTGFYRISENVIGVSTGGTLAATFGATGAFTAVAGITGTTGTFSGAVSTGALNVTGNIELTGNIFQSTNTSVLGLAGGSSSSSGGNIELYGGAHATQANNIIYDATTHIFRTQLGTTRLTIDSGANTVTATGGFTATTGTFSGAVSMTALTCTTISGTTPTFTGTMQSERVVSTSGVFSQDAAGSIFLRPDGPSSTTGQTSISSTGDMVVAGTITASSDARFKTDIETLENSLDKINRLRGVSFSFVEGGKKTIGVIAQEVREVLPELVLENEEGYLSVAYGNIVAVLIEAVKELTERVKVLEAK